MEMDAWQLSVSHKLNLNNLTTIAQMELMAALEPYRNRPVAELLAFLSRDILKLLKPFEELGRQMSVSYFEGQQALAAANPRTPVQPMEAIVVAALSADNLNNRGRGIAQIIRTENNPALAPVQVVEGFEDLPQPERPEPVRKLPPKPIKPPQAVVKEKMKTLTAEIKQTVKVDQPLDFDRIGEKVAEAAQAQLFEDDRDNLDYYADLEKTIKAVKRIPSSGGCAWCKSAALFMDGDSKSHKFCKCTTGYIFEGEDDDKFLDDEQRQFRDDYEKAKDQLKSGEIQGRLLKNGTPEKERAMKQQIKDAAWAQRAEIEKAEADKLGRPLYKKEIKEIHRDRRKKSEEIAAKMNSGKPLSLEDKQTLHDFNLSVEDVRAPKYGQTQRNEDVLAALRRDNGYH